MGVAAAQRQSHAGGAWRLYVLAKAIDRDGTGKISREDLRQFTEHLGLEPRQWQRWLARARTIGLFSDVQDQGGQWDLILCSAVRGALILECEAIGPRKSVVVATALIGSAWRSRVWAAYEVNFRGRPISRQRMRELVAVPERTQRFRDAQAEVRRQSNYCKSRIDSDRTPMIAEFGGHRGVFSTRDGKAAWRLPDGRDSDQAQRGPVGRARKANKELAQLRLDGSFIVQRPLSPSPSSARPVRLFYQARAHVRSALRKLSVMDQQRPREIYELAGRSLAGSQIWAPHSV